MGITKHDPTKILLGSIGSSDRVVTRYDSDPASFPAGRAVRAKSDGKISLASGDGFICGISLGADLSSQKKTAVARVGNRVPIELAEYLVKADLSFIKKTTAPVAIEFLAGASAGSEIATLTGDATNGYLVSLSMDNVSTKSTATQCKTALDANADVLALIETVIASGQGSAEQSAFAEDDIDSQAQAVIGAAVRVSNVTGKAIPTASSAGTLTGAVYADTIKDGIDPITGSVAYKVAAIDMGGGL